MVGGGVDADEVAGDGDADADVGELCADSPDPVACCAAARRRPVRLQAGRELAAGVDHRRREYQQQQQGCGQQHRQTSTTELRRVSVTCARSCNTMSLGHHQNSTRKQAAAVTRPRYYPCSL